MDLNEILAFVKVVQAGSFTAAAKTLNTPKSTVSAKVSALEHRLAVSLLHRTTRKLNLTEEGERFYRVCQQTLSELEAAEASVSGQSQSPRGQLKISVPTATGIHLMPAFLSGFLARHPDIKVKMHLTNRFVDLVGEGYDLAIRSGVLKDSSLVAKKIGTSYFSLFAAPQYLKQHKAPKKPDELSRHRCLSFAAIGDTWTLTHKGRRSLIKPNELVSVDDITAAKELAVSGLGVALLPRFVAQEDLDRRRLIALLPEWHAHATGIYIVYPPHKYLHPRVRVFVSELAEALRGVFGPHPSVIEN